MPAEWDDARARAVLRQVFDAAVARADAGMAVRRHLPDKPSGRCVVVGAGKASASMAAALEAAWPDVRLSGIVVTRYGHAVPAGRIEIVEAGHPVPDENGLRAARRIVDAVRGLGADDLVVALISGGGSALLTAPGGSISLEEKQAINRALLSSGATIGQMNTVRKQLSAIKGGRLARAAAPARVVTLVISDVPGDDPSTIASGPTVADRSTPSEARAILGRFGIPLPPSVLAVLAAADAAVEPAWPAGDVRVIAAPVNALMAAAEVAREHGLTPLVLGDAIEGESREVGIVMAGIARSVRRHAMPVAAPALLLSGGETTVSIRGGAAGRGGRNTEFLLGLAAALDGEAGIWAIAGDSDGIDGTEEAAGAIVTPDTLARARAYGLDPRSVLAAHDSCTLFEAIGDLVVTGPTLTNVNDIRAILVGP